MTSSAVGDEGIAPFATCITIASACNLVFRTNFLRPETIGIIPAQGYRPDEKQSVKALQWIKYVAQFEGVHIQHARNGGEKTIDQYRVDGYYETKDGEKVVMEYHGCFWHGCPKCYTRQTINTVNKLTMADLYHLSMEKITHIEKQGYTYNCIYYGNVNLTGIFGKMTPLILSTLLEPRDAFSGGRTEAFKLYHESAKGESIKYYPV